MTDKPKRARWFLQHLGSCPVCGREKLWKEAKYTEPPPKNERYDYMSDVECYDWCDAL